MPLSFPNFLTDHDYNLEFLKFLKKAALEALKTRFLVFYTHFSSNFRAQIHSFVKYTLSALIDTFVPWELLNPLKALSIIVKQLFVLVDLFEVSGCKGKLVQEHA
jgi:hypothetical protein